MINQSYEFIGTVNAMGSPETYSGQNGDFTKQEIWVNSDGNYPQIVKFIFTQKSVDKLTSVKIGDRVVIQFRITGRIYETNEKTVNFTELNGYNIKVIEPAKEKPNTSDSQSFTPEPEPVAYNPAPPDDSSDLPF